MANNRLKDMKPSAKILLSIVCGFIGLIIIDICTTLSTPGGFPILTCLILWFGFPALAFVIIVMAIIQSIKNRHK